MSIDAEHCIIVLIVVVVVVSPSYHCSLESSSGCGQPHRVVPLRRPLSLLRSEIKETRRRGGAEGERSKRRVKVKRVSSDHLEDRPVGRL